MQVSRPEEDERARLQRLQAANAVGAELTREIDLAVLLGLISQRAQDLLAAELAVVWLWDEKGAVLIPHPSPVPGAQPWPTDLRLRPGEGVAGAVAQSRHGIIVNDYPSWPGAQPRFLQQTAVAAVVAEPLFHRDRFRGVIAVGRIAPGRPFTTHHQETLQLVAPYIAIALENARTRTRSLRREEELEALVRAIHALRTDLDLRGMLDRLVREAARITGSAEVSVFLMRQETGGLELVVQRGAPGSALAASAAGPGLLRLVAESRAPVFSADVTRDPRNPEAARDRDLGLVSFLGLPLLSRSALLGVLGFYTQEPREFDAETLAYLTSFADEAALTIETAWLYAEAGRQEQEARLLADIAASLNASLDVDTVLARVAEAARTLCRADLAQLALCDPASQDLIFRYMAGARYPHYDQVRIAPGQGIGGLVVVTGQPFRTANYADDPRISKERLDVIRAEGGVAALAVPVRTPNRLEGVLYAYHRSARAFTDGDEALLARLADHAAIAIKNARLYQELTVHRDTLRSLSAKMTTAREEEARRIARELHDEVGQSLTSVLLKLQGLQAARDIAEVGTQAEAIAGVVKAGLEEIHRIIRALRPVALDHVGLLPALERHVQGFASATGLRIDLCAPGLERLRFPDHIASTVFRIAQEALTNVAKHAGARSVSVMLTRRGGNLALVIEDDGQGFDVREVRSRPAGRHLGLVGIEERAQQVGGTVKVESTPGSGTTLVVEIPLPNGEERSP